MCERVWILTGAFALASWSGRDVLAVLVVALVALTLVMGGARCE